MPQTYLKSATPFSERLDFYSIPEPNSGCLLWTGAVDGTGYPLMRINKKRVSAHRCSYEMAKGVIPLGMSVCHKCDVRSCINPDHLFLGTHADNMADMARKGRAAKPLGNLNARTRLTDADVREIRLSMDRQVDIAARFGISQGAVNNIKRGHRRSTLGYSR